VALVTPEGTVLAHSDPARVGSTLSFTLPEADKPAFRFVHEKPEAFEAARVYEPWFRQRGGNWEMCSFNGQSPVKNTYTWERAESSR